MEEAYRVMIHMLKNHLPISDPFLVFLSFDCWVLGFDGLGKNTLGSPNHTPKKSKQDVASPVICVTYTPVPAYPRFERED